MTWNAWNEWTDMNQLKWMTWHEWLDINEMHDLKWVNGNEWLDMNDLTWTTWHERIDMSEMQPMNGDERIEMKRRTPAETETLQRRPWTPQKYKFLRPRMFSSVNSRFPDRSHFPTTWWWCGWHDDVVPTMTTAGCENRSQFGNFLTKLPLIQIVSNNQTSNT